MTAGFSCHLHLIAFTCLLACTGPWEWRRELCTDHTAPCLPIAHGPQDRASCSFSNSFPDSSQIHASTESRIVAQSVLIFFLLLHGQGSWKVPYYDV